MMKIPKVCCIHVSKEGIPCINKTICQVQEEVYQLGIYSYSCSIFGTSVSFLDPNELQLGFLLKGMPKGIIAFGTKLISVLIIRYQVI